MDKLLIDKNASFTLFDADTNAIKQVPYPMIGTAFVADKDGQAISTTEVMDYKKDDVVLVFVAVVNNQPYTKVVRCEDIFSKYDIAEWYNSLVKPKE